MKTYVITLSKNFMSGHPKEGQPTNFKQAFLCGQNNSEKTVDCPYRKIHTIRENYPLWESRIKEVQAGEAILSIRQWSGKPYRSPQETIANLTKDNGVGIQLLDCDQPFALEIDGKAITSREHTILAGNDGLSLDDWEKWFDIVNASGKKAIIHFTKYRY